MNKSIQDAQGKKDQLQSILVQINGKLEGLQTEKDNFNEYDIIEKNKKAIERCLYAQKLSETLKQIEIHREEKANIMTQRENLVNQREEFLRNAEIENTGSQANQVSQLKVEISKIEHKIKGLE